MAKQGPLSGQKLGDKYLLGDLLGKGGFGAVYQAHYLLLNRPQAIKILLEEHFSDPRFLDRFLREARTLAALDHPNIVHVDELGVQGSLIYLVMPYLSRGTLQDLLNARGEPLPLEEVDRALSQICAALDYAHAQGVVHLDLKPLNLLVHQDGRLLLSDFGLAHLMKEGAVQGGTSLSFGTPTYMAPEHLRGQPDWRSDLYALGIILYQMLTGHPPFAGSTPEAVMLKHVMDPPPSLRAARPDLPAALESVLAKALAKQPEDRYQRASDLLSDFRAALTGQMSQPGADIYSTPTRISQPPLSTTVRAANPPVTSLHRLASEQKSPVIKQKIASSQSPVPPSSAPTPAPANRFFSMRRTGRYFRAFPLTRWVFYLDIVVTGVLLSVWFYMESYSALPRVGAAAGLIIVFILGAGTRSKTLARLATFIWASAWGLAGFNFVSVIGVTNTSLAGSPIPLIVGLIAFIGFFFIHLVVFYGATAQRP